MADFDNIIPSDLSDDQLIANLPTRWAICGECTGEGKSSAHLGAISSEQWQEEWDYEEREAYLAGQYDRICAECKGSGKVREISEHGLSPAQRGWYSELMGRYEIRAAIASERRAIARMGGEY